MLSLFVGFKTKLLQYNPVNIGLRRLLRSRLKDREITILSSNCLGGLLYDQMGLKFLSPTINTLITSDQFVRFLLDYEAYLKKELVFIESERPYPVAQLGDIQIHFAHYKTAEEAAACWRRRKGRIRKEQLFVLLNDRDGVTDEDLCRLDESGLKNVLVFTANKNLNHRCTFYVPCQDKDGMIGNLMMKSWITGKMVVERYFDFVGWFNQEKGSKLENYRMNARL